MTPKEGTFFKNMTNETESHKKLVLRYERLLRSNGFDTIKYGVYRGRRPNIIALRDGKIKGIAECIVTRNLKDAVEKLEMLPGGSGVKKEIVRWKRPRNPKAVAAIEAARRKGIYLMELEDDNVETD